MTIFQSIQAQFTDKDANAKAINVARRLTRNNEPDLLREFGVNGVRYDVSRDHGRIPIAICSAMPAALRLPFIHNTNTIVQLIIILPHHVLSLSNNKEEDRDEKFSHEFCKMMALKVHTESDFPVECRDYYDAMVLLKRRNSGSGVKKEADAYAGMSSGDRIDAMRAKDEGHLNSAQIKRRMTTRKNGRLY
ncbi:hypothetical protein HJC23_001697 [Cyclotella cryptica]|uniref:Uncharacterized protein n=1 Tax=Cyclotella cryptica TaxID=29204 RepID=A0ABD3QKF6_9STRA